MNRYQKYNKKSHNIKRIWALDYLGGECRVCGSTDRMEFDHINPKSVEFRIGANLGKSKQQLSVELIKCQLLCHNCHWNKTLRERGHKKADHGTISMYANQKCRCGLCRKANTEYYRNKYGYQERTSMYKKFQPFKSVNPRLGYIRYE